MLRVSEVKVLNILEIKDRGLKQSDAVKITGYSKTMVYSVYAGSYETVLLVMLGEWEFYKETHSRIISITKNDYEFQDFDCFTNATTETPEDFCIRREGAEELYTALDTLSVRDRNIIQAKADGQNNGQIIAEFSTSAGHIKKIQEKLQEELGR